MPAVRLAHLDVSRVQGPERRRAVPARDPEHSLHVGQHVRPPDVEPDDGAGARRGAARRHEVGDRKSTRLNSSHGYISYAVFCLKKKKEEDNSLYEKRN